MQNEYYIKNKDRVLGMIEWLDEDVAVLSEDIALPFFIKDDVLGWLQSRTPPKHREHIDKLLKQCNLKSIKSIIDFSKGLALTDTLWVTSDLDIKWDEVSLFTNKFNDVISRIAFTGGLFGIGFSTTSPEFGTNGMLPKCWVREKDGIYLYKGGTSGFSNTGNEPYSEVLASQVLDCLEYPHINYTLAKYHGETASKCKLYTSERVMMLPIFSYFAMNDLNVMVKHSEDENFKTLISECMIFDHLCCNTDRHAGNISVVLNADTFEYIGMCPIYDNGCSMLCYWNGTDDIDDYVSRTAPALYGSFIGGALVGKAFLKNKHNVSKLVNFKFDRTQVEGYPDSRIDAIEKWIQTRAGKFLSYQ